MRYALAIATVLSATFVAPAFAADRAVPQATLKSLGLGSMQFMTDADASKVRGMSSNAMAMGTSLVSGLLIDPATKSFIFGASADTAMATAENAGLQPVSEATISQSSGVNLNMTVETGTSYFTGTISGGAGGGASAWAF